MENLKVGEIYHITDKEYPGKKIIYKHEKMSDEVRGFGYYISDMNTGHFEFKKSTSYLKDRDIKKATELESEWLKHCIKNNNYISYFDFMMEYKHKLRGRKVRALIDRPNGGMVLKGEIGIITSTSGCIYVDFPSQQDYILNGDIDESKIELLPEVIQGFKEEDLVEAKNPEKLVFGKFNIGDIVVSMTDVTGYRDKGDLFVVLRNSSKHTLWYRTHIDNNEINSTKSDGWRLATDDEKKLYENGFTNINYKCCVKITKENVLELNLFLELNKDKYSGYHPYWGVSEDSIGKFFHFPSYNGSVGYIHTSSTKYYPEVTLEELYEKAGYKPIEKKPSEIKAVLEEMAFRVKDHKKEQKDNRLIQLKIRDKSVTTTTQQRVRLKIIKPSLITIKN